MHTMFNNNEVTLTGFVGGDAKAKKTGKGTSFTVVSLATSKGRKNRDTGAWTNDTTWHRLVGWGKVAESMTAIKKGAFIQVRGEIRNYELPAKGDRAARQVTEIVVTQFARLNPQRRGEQVQEAAA
jgi:single-strand DNA-binding protein